MQPDAPSGNSTSYAQPAPVNFDPLASFLTTPVEADLGGRVFVIEMPMADFWLGVFLDQRIEWDAILPGLLSDEDQTWVEEQMLLGEITSDDLNKSIQDLVTLVAGVKWWTAASICSVARHNWDRVGGHLIRSGLGSTQQLTFGAWVVGAFSSMMEHVDPKQAANFVAELTKPPVGYEEEMDPEEEEAAFLAAMAMM